MPANPFPPSPLRMLATRLALAGWLCAVAGVAFAQETLPALTTSFDETRVLPVWSHASGRVEAVLLLDEAPTAAAAGALDRLLANDAPGLGFGTRVELEDGSRVRGTLQFDGDAGLALLCDGVTGSLGAFGRHCLLATLDAPDPLLAGAARNALLGVGWQSADGGVDLSFGLSWLSLRPEPAAWLDAGEDAGAFFAGGAAGWPRELDARSVRLDSLITLGPRTRMLIGGGLGRQQARGIDGTPLAWESAALTFGVGHGAFTGRLTGRLIEVPQSGSQWSTLDIGVSWRTPWRGELSVGARNVLGGVDTARWPLTELPPLEESAARVPYVRYQQDL
jgi:hypothetical protein